MTITLETLMLGPVDMTRDEIIARFSGNAYDDATVGRFAAALLSFTASFGLRTSLIAAQIGKETGFFKFGGDVSPDQYNLAGLGATGGGVAGLSYTSIEEGVAAVCAHHMVYLFGAVENWPNGSQTYVELDQRYSAVLSAGKGGTVRAIGDYRNGWWAYTASIPVGSLDNGYARGIVELANGMTTNGAPPPAQGGNVADLSFLIDIRDQLPTASDGNRGPLATGITPRKGAIQHYSATPWTPGSDFVQQMVNEAQYHVNKGWGNAGGAPYGDGIMYHIGVNPDTGEAYQMRDLDATLWHCGYWGDGGNDSGYAVHVPGDANLVLTPAGLAGLTRVHDALRARDGYDRSMVKGHQEVSSTACPGPLMEQFVIPYRNGELASAPNTPPPGTPDTGLSIDGFPVGEGVHQLYYSVAADTNARLRIFGLCKTTEHDEYLVVDNPDASSSLKKIAFPVVCVRFERNKIIWDKGRTPAPFDTRIPLETEYVGPADDSYVDATLKAMQAAHQ